MSALSDQTIVLGEGSTQVVEGDLVRRLEKKLVAEGKIGATANETTVLRTFVQGIKSWEMDEPEVVEYTVQPGDTWAGISGRFYGDQMRYEEIIAFNGLPPNATLFVGQVIRISMD